MGREEAQGGALRILERLESRHAGKARETFKEIEGTSGVDRVYS
jgi:hypothetical protein